MTPQTVLHCFSAILFIAHTQAVAFAGYESHGGDTLRARAELIERYVLEDLKTDLLETGFKNLEGTIHNVDASKFESKADARFWGQMVLNGLREDIERSRYTVSGGCYEGKVSKDASAGLGELGGAICFDPESLAAKNVSLAEIQALAIHEHAHHYKAEEAMAIRMETAILVRLADRNSLYYARSKKTPQWLIVQEKERGLEAEDPSSEAENEDYREESEPASTSTSVTERRRVSPPRASQSAGESGAYYCSARCTFNVVTLNPDYHPESSWWDFFFGDEKVVRRHSHKIAARSDVRFEAFLQLQTRCEDLCADAQGETCPQNRIGELRTIGDVTWEASERNACRLVE